MSYITWQNKKILIDKDFIISVAVLYELNFNALTQYLNGYQKKKKKMGIVYPWYVVGNPGS